mmetsp:Transcript_8278/g.23751  ORF Transcript_8278/g.23751 Transcript_8278/m.23751 type:complete len:260 (+) Transcript_8278:195-974(+)
MLTKRPPLCKLAFSCSMGSAGVIQPYLPFHAETVPENFSAETRVLGKRWPSPPPFLPLPLPLPLPLLLPFNGSGSTFPLPFPLPSLFPFPLPLPFNGSGSAFPLPLPLPLPLMGSGSTLPLPLPLADLPPFPRPLPRPPPRPRPRPRDFAISSGSTSVTRDSSNGSWYPLSDLSSSSFERVMTMQGTWRTSVTLSRPSSNGSYSSTISWLSSFVIWCNALNRRLITSAAVTAFVNALPVAVMVKHFFSISLNNFAARET